MYLHSLNGRRRGKKQTTVRFVHGQFFGVAARRGWDLGRRTVCFAGLTPDVVIHEMYEVVLGLLVMTER
jgi:hypothetical protein